MNATRGRLPILAYVYHPRSFPTFDLVNAARDLCDLVWIVDTSNVDVGSMVRLLERSGAIVDVAGLTYDEAATKVATQAPMGILSLADDLLNWTAEVARRLELPFLSVDTARRLTDKHAQRQALEKAGLAVPAHAIVNEGGRSTSWAALERQIRFPAVLKPRRGEASRDTFLVESLGELRELWQRVDVVSTPAREFVVEEFIADSPTLFAGTGFANYVSVESFVCDGTISHLAINGRMPPAFPFRETGFFIPSALDVASSQAVLNVATGAIEAMGVTVGCLHTEIKLTDAGPVVIEVNGRIGGGVPEMLAKVTDLRFLTIAMQLALGHSVVVDEVTDFDQVAFLFYVQARAEIRSITSIEGLAELGDVVGVDEVILNRGPGQSVDWREGNHGHVFSVLGTVANYDELRTMDDVVKTLVKIEGD